MRCPHCGFVFKELAANAYELPPLAPIVCESCAEVSLSVHGKVRKLLPLELDQLKQSPAWKNIIGPAIAIINAQRAKRS
jgi:hypothetical protein